MLLVVFLCDSVFAHDIITTKITFNREIVRIFNKHCVSCHHAGGSSFSLTTYQEARPWAKAIEEEVLQRRMPPWGAVKGFGNFRNDLGFTMEQLEVIVDWVEGGAPEGDEKDLPGSAAIVPVPTLVRPPNAVVISGDTKLSKPMVLDGLWPNSVPAGAAFQVVAETPDGAVLPLLWLQDYNHRFDHPFLLRNPIQLPAGTTIRGVPRGASISLLPGSVRRIRSISGKRLGSLQ